MVLNPGLAIFFLSFFTQMRQKVSLGLIKFWWVYCQSKVRINWLYNVVSCNFSTCKMLKCWAFHYRFSRIPNLDLTIFPTTVYFLANQNQICLCICCCFSKIFSLVHFFWIPEQLINEKVIKSSLFFRSNAQIFLEINQIYFCTGPTSDGSAAGIIVSEDFVKSRGLEDRVMLILIYSYKY